MPYTNTLRKEFDTGVTRLHDIFRKSVINIILKLFLKAENKDYLDYQ